MLGRARAMLPADDAVGGVVKYPCTLISADIYYRKVHIKSQSSSRSAVRESEGGGRPGCANDLILTRRREDLTRALKHSPAAHRHLRPISRTHAHTPTQLYRQLPRKQLLSDAPRPLPLLLINNQSISTLIALAYRQASATRRLP